MTSNIKHLLSWANRQSSPLLCFYHLQSLNGYFLLFLTESCLSVFYFIGFLYKANREIQSCLSASTNLPICFFLVNGERCITPFAARKMPLSSFFLVIRTYRVSKGSKPYYSVAFQILVSVI